jgi:hypothetical protein
LEAAGDHRIVVPVFTGYPPEELSSLRPVNEAPGATLTVNEAPGATLTLRRPFFARIGFHDPLPQIYRDRFSYPLLLFFMLTNGYNFN